MSQFEHESPSDYTEMSPTRRYYNDINYVRENLTSAILAIDSLVQHTPFDSDVLFKKMLASEMMPMDWEMENDIVIAKEKLSLLPIHVHAKELENSDFDLSSLKNWYQDLLSGISMITNDIHTNDCLQSMQTAHDMCDYSTTCPRRYVQRYLLAPALHPDFTDDIYKTAPKRQFTIVKDKLDLAISNKIITAEACEGVRETYETQYNNYMSKRSINSPDAIA